MPRTLKVAIFCLLGLLTLFVTTEPQKLPSLILIVPFILIFTILCLVSFCVALKRGIRLRESVRVVLMIAALPTLLIVLQSLGELTPRDVLTVAALFVITYFYIVRLANPAGGKNLL
jgi:hypothetical protein